MQPSTRRRVLQGIGAASVVGAVGVGTASADEHDDASTNDETTDQEHDDADHEEEAFAAVRCAHLSPDTPAVDVYLGKEPDLNPTIGGLEFPTFGPRPNDGYLQVPPGTYDVAVAPAGTTDPAIQIDDQQLGAGGRYTLLAVGRLSDVEGQPELQPIAVVDAGSRAEATPPEHQTEVSFVHASPDAGPVDITADGEPLLEGVEFGDVSDYLAVDPGPIDVGIRSEGEEVLAVTRDLRAGTRITVSVVGLAAPGEDDLPGLSAVTSLDGTNPLPETILTR